MSKTVFIVRNDEHHDYDAAALEAYTQQLLKDGFKFTRKDDVERSDGNKQSEFTFDG